MIYILEDDDSIRKLVTYALESQGYEVEGFGRPSAFYEALEKKIPDLLLLDIMLPEEDGISILKKLRADSGTARLPVIMLTAKSTEYDHVEGLDAGADDYVAKPFGMMELLARVRALLRRAEVSAGRDRRDPDQEKETQGAGVSQDSLQGTASAAEEGKDRNPDGAGQSAAADSPYDGSAGGKTAVKDLLEYGRIRIYPKKYEVFEGDEEIGLTNKEYQLLLLLVNNEGNVMTREVLLDRIWDLGKEPENRTLDVHIRKLRSKLGRSGNCIETVRSVGYRFRAPVEE